MGAEPVRFVPVDRQADRATLLGLAEWCQQFAPRVGLNEAEFPDTLLLDVSGCGTYFGSEAVLVERVEQAFSEVGYTVCVVVADTIGAAWAVAHFGAIQIVPPEEPLTAVLSPLPVSALRLDDGTVRTLRELGVEQIGQLQSLPRSSLPARLGPQVLQRLDQALGLQPEILVPHRPLPPIEAKREFDEPLEQRQAVEHLGQAMLEKVLSAVEARGHGVVRLTFHIQMEAGQQVLALGVSRPTLAMKHLHTLLRLRLERQPPPRPVMSLRLRVRETAPMAIRQSVWWVADDSADRREREQATLVDRLSSRLGAEAVLRARLTGEAQPELSLRYEPWIPQAGSPQPKTPRRTTRTAPRTMIPPRPWRLLSRPVAVRVISVVPDGPPRQFEWRTTKHLIDRWWGPERLATGWWRKSPAARDYYRVETRGGLHAWLFRTHDGWYLQGWFD